MNSYVVNEHYLGQLMYIFSVNLKSPAQSGAVEGKNKEGFWKKQKCKYSYYQTFPLDKTRSTFNIPITINFRRRREHPSFPRVHHRAQQMCIPFRSEWREFTGVQNDTCTFQSVSGIQRDWQTNTTDRTNRFIRYAFSSPTAPPLPRRGGVNGWRRPLSECVRSAAFDDVSLPRVQHGGGHADGNNY